MKQHGTDSLDERHDLYLLSHRHVCPRFGYTESPKTWDEFMDALRKVKAEYNIDPFIFDLAGNQSNHLLLLSLLNNGVGCCKYDANNNVFPLCPIRKISV